MILPSSSEGFGMVFIESIACGTPVILPKILPLANEPNILCKKNSILLDGSEVDSITNCLVNLPDKNNYDEGEVSKTVDHLSWISIAGQYREIFRSIIYQSTNESSEKTPT